MKFNLDLDSIKYIKIVYKDKFGNARCIKAGIKDFGERDLYACAKPEENLFIPVPQEVSLSIVCTNGLYRTNTTLKYAVKEEPYLFLALSSPQGLEYRQNREYFRVEIEKDVLINFEENVIHAKTYDISANGVRIVLDEKIQFPETVSLDISLESGNIQTMAKYVRTDNEDNILKVSFYFIDLSENNRDFISKMCIQKQLENKRNALK